jgi:hypothetical protein
MTKIKLGTKIGLFAAVLAGLTTRYWFHLTGEVALPSDRTGFALVFLLCAVLGVLAFIKRTSWLGAVPPVFAIVVGLFFPATMLISEQVISPDAAIEVGDRIPRFTSIDDAGVEFDSRSLNGHLVLIKFFRAHW